MLARTQSSENSHFLQVGGYIFWKILWHCLHLLCLPRLKNTSHCALYRGECTEHQDPGVQYQEEQCPSSTLTTTQIPMERSEEIDHGVLSPWNMMWRWKKTNYCRRCRVQRYKHQSLQSPRLPRWTPKGTILDSKKNFPVLKWEPPYFSPLFKKINNIEKIPEYQLAHFYLTLLLAIGFMCLRTEVT